MKKLIGFRVDKNNEEFINQQVEELNSNRTTVLNAMIRLVEEQATSTGFQIFFNNGYTIRDGRYKDGTV